MHKENIVKNDKEKQHQQNNFDNKNRKPSPKVIFSTAIPQEDLLTESVKNLIKKYKL